MRIIILIGSFLVLISCIVMADSPLIIKSRRIPECVSVQEFLLFIEKYTN